VTLLRLVTAFTAAALVAEVGAAQQVPAPIPEPADTGYVTYAEGPISLPLGFGFRLPTYDRVNGLSLAWGPKIATRNDSIRIDPTVTYRSHLGEFDPAVTFRVMSRGGFGVDFYGGRGTFTNDRWIRSDLSNSAAAIFSGSDARNYYRSDRASLELSQTVGPDSTQFRFGLGGQTENDWSTGMRHPVTSSPWSIFGRKDSLKMRRPNPTIWRGHISSALGRVAVGYTREEVSASVDAFLERAIDVRLDEPFIFFTPGGPISSVRKRSDNFTQVTIGSKAHFPTFGTQSFEFRGHFVISPDSAPPQRYAYLGGSGTLATVDQLAFGGDRLVYVQGEYSIPLDSLLLPFIGSPTLLVRYAAGSAGIQDLPDFIQNIGAGVAFKVVKVMFHYDPNYRKTSFSEKQKVTVGLSLPTL
jgi:hypothetical protein